MSTYILDSDVIIGAYSDYYRMGEFPGVWDWFVHVGEAGCISSIDRVRAELQDPGLPEWVDEELPDGFFRKPTAEVLAAHAKVADWTHAQSQYTPEAKAEFLDVADSYLIAHAVAGGSVIVTHEKSSPGSQASIKIPDAGRSFGVSALPLSDLFHRLGARFTLDAASMAGLAAKDG